MELFFSFNYFHSFNYFYSFNYFIHLILLSIKFIFSFFSYLIIYYLFVCLPIRYFIMNDDNDGVVKCQKNSTTPPRCHSDQVDPLVQARLFKFHTA